MIKLLQCSIISAPTFLLYVKMIQSARMQKTKKPPALAVMTRRLMAGGGLSDVELSFTALKSVTPGRKKAMINTSSNQIESARGLLSTLSSTASHQNIQNYKG